MIGALTFLLVALAALAWLGRALPVTLVAARMLQIEEYEDARFLRWGLTRNWLAHPSVIAAFGLSLVALVGATLEPSQRTSAVAAGWLAAAVAGTLLWRWPAAKRPLVFTARMRRILGVTAAYAIVTATATAVLLAAGFWYIAAILAMLIAFTSGLAQLLLVAADITLRPAEAAIRRGYVRQARARITSVSPLVVAVAGSYGKTSTKHILAQLLAGDESVLPTRKSFNTLMGVTRVINEDLQEQHRLFIVEMDAYAEGEIAAISDLVRPRIAVLTSVGPQHLERFGDMQSIANALYEVVQALPAEGTAFIHAGETGGAALADRAASQRREVVRYGVAGGERLDVTASDITVDGSGARFRWSWPQRGRQCSVSIPLLGRHQVLNVTAALAVVERLGYSLETAVRAAAALRPVEHRLELLQQTGPVRVIDDSYNANPVGVHDALDILASMNGGARVLVTPGLVELGSVEDEENRRYGRHAAAVCDHVIVMVARPSTALQAGLRDGGMSAERIHLAHDLSEATAIIGRITRAGDTVLFANDLPDTYLSG